MTDLEIYMKKHASRHLIYQAIWWIALVALIASSFLVSYLLIFALIIFMLVCSQEWIGNRLWIRDAKSIIRKHASQEVEMSLQGYPTLSDLLAAESVRSGITSIRFVFPFQFRIFRRIWKELCETTKTIRLEFMQKQFFDTCESREAPSVDQIREWWLICSRASEEKAEIVGKLMTMAIEERAARILRYKDIPEEDKSYLVAYLKGASMPERGISRTCDNVRLLVNETEKILRQVVIPDLSFEYLEKNLS